MHGRNLNPGPWRSNAADDDTDKENISLSTSLKSSINDASSEMFANSHHHVVCAICGKAAPEGGGGGLTHAKIFLVNLNNLLPGFWNTRALSIVASRIYALFVPKSTSVPGLGGGEEELSQSWQCQDFGSA